MDLMIDNITLINQNMQVPSSVAADFRAREIEKTETKKIEEEEKENRINEVDEVEEIEKVLPVENAKAVIGENIKHIDLKV